MLDIAHEHQDAGRRAYIVTAASQELADILAQVMAFDGAIGSNRLRGRGRRLHRHARRACSSTAPQRRRRSRSWPSREGIDLVGVLRLLGLGVRSADAPRRRPSGGGQPRRRPGPDRQAEGWQVLRFDRLGRRLKTGGRVAGPRRRPEGRAARRPSARPRATRSRAPAARRCRAGASAGRRPRLRPCSLASFAPAPAGAARSHRPARRRAPRSPWLASSDRRQGQGQLLQRQDADRQRRGPA